jgi:electron transfer flavoprotein beta subunit
MKVLVPVKRVIDANIKVRVKSDQSGVELNNVKMAMKPFCEIAVEQAIRLKESGLVDEIIVVTVGAAQSQETLRTALAMGADRAILIETEETPEPLSVAKSLKAVVDREGPGLVILGKQAIDGDNNQTGQMLAALLGWSIGTFISDLVVEESIVKVTREVDGGLEKLEHLPSVVVTVDLRLNEPRYASLPNIMKAKKKPLDTLSPSDLDVDVTPRTEVVSVVEPPAREAGVRVGSAEELVEKLKNEAKVI